MHALLREAASLVRLAMPIMAGFVAWSALVLIDGPMIGRIGTVELAAASLVTSVLMIVLPGVYGLLLPSAILTGEAHGSRDAARAAAVLRHALLAATLAGTVGGSLLALGWLAVPWLRQPAEVEAAALGYWLATAAGLLPMCLYVVAKQFYESIDRPWTGFALILPGLALKWPLNELLMFGAGPFGGMGLTGAPVATAIVQLVWLATLLAHLRWAPSMHAYRTARWWRRQEVVAQLRSGSWMSGQYMLEGGSAAVAGIAIGWFGAVALAANQIAMAVGNTLYMVPLGMAAAVAVRVAQATGAAEHRRLRAIADAANGVVTVWMLLAGALYVLAGRAIATAFTDDPAVLELAVAMFLVFAAMQVFDGVQSVSLGALRGMHDTRWPMLVSLVAYWLVSLPVGGLLAWPLGMGAPGIWAGFGLGLGIAAVLLWQRLRQRTAGAHLAASPSVAVS